MDMIKQLLHTDFTQFGFKANSGCRNAITCLKATVQYYCAQGSTVNICALDIAKAFDKVNHFALLHTLMQRNVDRFIISLLQYWLVNSVACVRWQNCLSYWFPIKAGVRQGGILSPVLFNMYIDVLYQRLKQLGVGCYLFGVFSSCLLYAADILLLSHSYIALQHMLDVCCEFSVEYDM